MTMTIIIITTMVQMSKTQRALYLLPALCCNCCVSGRALIHLVVTKDNLSIDNSQHPDHWIYIFLHIFIYAEDKINAEYAVTMKSNETNVKFVQICGR